jgi:hypothetical protein
VNHTTNNVRTTDTDRLEYLRLFKGCLQAYLAEGKDIEDAIKDLDRAIARREKEMKQ